MKLAGRAAERFLKAPDAAVAALLLYGPDAGLVRERAEALTRAVAGSLDDPFQISLIEAAQLRDDPARLADEALQLSLIGGRRVLRLREAGDAAAPLLEALLAGPTPAAFVIVEAGELGPRSPLRRLFEERADAAALACYRDEGGDLGAFLRDALQRRGVTVEEEALAYLAANLGADRALTRAEIEKLALFAGAGGRIGLADAIACVGDGAAVALEDAAFAAADGDLPALDRALERCFGESEPVRILRVASGHFLRLHQVAGLLAAGVPVERAMRGLRPPVFYKRESRFRAQAARLPAALLARAIESLLEAELACKRTGLPAEAVCRQALMAIAREAAAPEAGR